MPASATMPTNRVVTHPSGPRTAGEPTSETVTPKHESPVEVPLARQRKMMLDDEFYCRPRRRRLSLEKCLEDYMNANAFATKRAACWRCPQGCNIRHQFADEGV